MLFTKAFVGCILKIFVSLNPVNFLKKSETFLAVYGSSVFITITISSLNDIFFKDADLKNVWAPIFITVLMLLIYLGMIFIDFVLGQRVAIKIRKEKFDADRLIDTIAKVFATIFIAVLIMVLSILTEVIKFKNYPGISSSAWMISILCICIVWTLIIGYEFGSIGRHLESLTGSKPGIFKFMDKVFKSIQDKAIKKVEKSFNFTGDEKDSIDNTSGSD